MAEPLYLCRPEPLRGPSFEELSLDDDSFDELSFDELSLGEPSFEPPSDLDLSSFLSLDPESPPDVPAEEPFFA